MLSDIAMYSRTNNGRGRAPEHPVAASRMVHTSPGTCTGRARAMAEDSAGPEGVFGHRLRIELGLDAAGPDAVERAAGLVQTYGAGGFTGAAFDTYGRNDPVRITGDDLIAVSMLSIQIREHSNAALRPSSIRTLDSLAASIAKLLAALPADRDLHTLREAEFDRWLGPGSSGDDLYWMLRKQAGIPPVAVYKLLARKRLGLFPIRDSVVSKAVRQTADPWWRPWWEALAGDPEIVAHLDRIRQVSGAGHLSLLRVADIVVWMTHHPSAQAGAQE